MVANLPAFLAISVVVIVTPGPDTALTIRNTLLGGRSGGVWTAIGVCCGQAIWVSASSVGAAALLRASEPLFLTLRAVGVAYLAYLGVQALRSAFAKHTPSRSAPSGASGEPRSPAPAFRQGLISNLSNPKMALFFTSLLPQFISRGGASFAMVPLLGLAFCSMTLTWLSGYAFVVARAGDVLRRSRVRRAVEGLTGTVLIGAAARLATEHG